MKKITAFWNDLHPSGRALYFGTPLLCVALAVAVWFCS
jgi:hypothetical protein